jgi:FtsP/CotA-like multicopper oxidase with cupredoxin domain
MNRRSFIRTTGGAVAGTGLLGLAGARDVLAARPAAVIRYPLRIPPTVSPAGLTLTAAPSLEDLGGASMSNAWTYNSELPGPTIAASTGDNASITLVNGLAEETITHWHGMLVDDVNDGHPRFAIPPGGTYDYNFTIQNRACLNWYHPHPHMLTGKQVNLGLAGAFIVRDAEETALGLPSGAYEIPLVIRDATRDKAGNLQYQPRSGGFDGKIPLVNGTRSPYLAVDRALYRFRILNGANARIFRLALDNGTAFTLIGNDGGLLETAVSLGQIDVAPGERLDLIVDFRGAAAGGRIMLRDLRAGWDLLELRVSATIVGGSVVPTTLSAITSLSLADVQAVRDFSFDGMSKINGREYDMERVDFQVPFDQSELWRFHTNGNAPHPVHVHGASFQVISRSGGRGALFPWEAGWKDTVLLEDGESVEVLIRFTAYRGLYLMHCHKLEHEDMGMMSNFEVI